MIVRDSNIKLFIDADEPYSASIFVDELKIGFHGFSIEMKLEEANAIQKAISHLLENRYDSIEFKNVGERYAPNYELISRYHSSGG